MSVKIKPPHGGRRAGAGRPAAGGRKARFTVNLTVATVETAKKHTDNLSATIDTLLAEWSRKAGADKSTPATGHTL